MANDTRLAVLASVLIFVGCNAERPSQSVEDDAHTVYVNARI